MVAQASLCGVRYPARYEPPQLAPPRSLHFLRERLRDNRGRAVDSARLRGMSVAFLFGMKELVKFRTAVQLLAQFYRTVNEASHRQKLEIIYVPLDGEGAETSALVRSMPWLTVDPLPSVLQLLVDKFGVRCAGSPFAPRAGGSCAAPSLIVVGPGGHALRTLRLDQQVTQLARELDRWDYAHNALEYHACI